jgi:hypothetical protein
MKDTEINDTAFKNFCDGRMMTTMLYKDGQQNFQHNCKAVITANTMPSMIVNSGITRKIEAYTHP